jgi:hypothetical protein
MGIDQDHIIPELLAAKKGIVLQLVEGLNDIHLFTSFLNGCDYVESLQKTSFILYYRKDQTEIASYIVENVTGYIGIPEPTPKSLRVFAVHEKEEKYSRVCGNTTVIHYTFQIPKQKTATSTMATTAVTSCRKGA